MPYTLRITPAGSADATLLIAGLDADLNARYPGEEVNGIDADEFEAHGGTFVVGYLNDVPVACGALRPFEDAIEVKRMFVAPDQRGRGLARQLLKFLEDVARKRGFTRAILETGSGQPEAIALYEATGWKRIANFGKYVDNDWSVCFEKNLSPRA
jgi:GNAT superfamily N-acetyltransferase